jgi:hypothetical protein
MPLCPSLVVTLRDGRVGGAASRVGCEDGRPLERGWHYPGSMDYSQLHRAVDQLSPDQAKALLVVVTSMLGGPVEAGSADAASAVPEPARHRLSFTAAGSGPADLAERADDYLGAGAFGYPGS